MLNQKESRSFPEALSRISRPRWTDRRKEAVKNGGLLGDELTKKEKLAKEAESDEGEKERNGTRWQKVNNMWNKCQ